MGRGLICGSTEEEAQMPIRLKCEKCGKALRAADGAAGKRVRCPGCGTVLTVPTPPANPPFAEAVALEESAPAPAPASVQKPSPQATAAAAPVGKKKKTGLIIALVAAVIVVGLIVAGKGVLLAALISLGLVVLCIVGVWKLFVKAGQPGWAALIPIYNTYVMLKVAGKPGWWLILFFIPAVGFVIAILVALAIAAAFGKGAGFAVGLILLPIVFYPILGFGSAQYKGAQN
jgi:phage FluMu protein Com